MKRRTFLAQSSLAAVGMALAPDFAFAENPLAPGYSLEAWAGTYAKGLEELTKLGFKEYEFELSRLTQEPAGVENFNKLLTTYKADVRVLSLGSVPLKNARANLQGWLQAIPTYARSKKQILKFVPADTSDNADTRTAYATKYAAIANRLAGISDMIYPVAQNRYDGVLAKFSDLKTFLDALPAKNAGIALDTAHYAAAGGNLAEDLLKFGDRLKIIYLQDCVLQAGQQPVFCPLGGGNVDLQAVLNFVRTSPNKILLMVQSDDRKIDPTTLAQTNKAYLVGKNAFKAGTPQ